jgi:signal peptidase II
MAERDFPGRTLAIGLIGLVVLLDQAMKAWVLNGLNLSPPGCLERVFGTCGKIEISGIFDMTMVWNRGMSFGLFESEGLARWGLFAWSGVIAIIFAVWLWRADRGLTRLALGLVVGGAIGNLIDRARFGAVADFFDFSGLWFPYVFNIADAAITVGAITLLIDQLLMAPKPRKPDGQT